jgi:hypothetical protein
VYILSHLQEEKKHIHLGMGDCPVLSCSPSVMCGSDFKQPTETNENVRDQDNAEQTDLARHSTLSSSRALIWNIQKMSGTPKYLTNSSHSQPSKTNHGPLNNLCKTAIAPCSSEPILHTGNVERKLQTCVASTEALLSYIHVSIAQRAEEHLMGRGWESVGTALPRLP